MNEEILKLLKENNLMLKEIIAYINLKEHKDNQVTDDFKSLLINVIANGLIYNK